MRFLDWPAASGRLTGDTRGDEVVHALRYGGPWLLVGLAASALLWLAARRSRDRRLAVGLSVAAPAVGVVALAAFLWYAKSL